MHVDWNIERNRNIVREQNYSFCYIFMFLFLPFCTTIFIHIKHSGVVRSRENYLNPDLNTDVAASPIPITIRCTGMLKGIPFIVCCCFIC